MSGHVSDDPGPSRARFGGVYPGVVTDVQDPLSQGRVKVQLPFLHGPDAAGAQAWARLATMMAGNDRGTWFIPEVGDEVLVAFFAGDPSAPVVIGALWNGRDAPPETMDSQNNIRSITSRSGHRIVLDDTSAFEQVRITTQGGHRLQFNDTMNGEITLEHSNGVKLKMDIVGNIEITANVKVTINAPGQLSVSAGVVQVDSAMSNFSGVVRCDTLITNSVVSPSYTPGAGNVW
jgi:phage baseplate assembly protein V